MTWHSDHRGSGAVSWRGLTLCSLYRWDGLGSETQAMIGNESDKHDPQHEIKNGVIFSSALITASLWIHCTSQQGKWTSTELECETLGEVCGLDIVKLCQRKSPCGFICLHRVLCFVGFNSWPSPFTLQF